MRYLTLALITGISLTAVAQSVESGIPEYYYQDRVPFSDSDDEEAEEDLSISDRSWAFASCLWNYVSWSGGTQAR